MNSVRVRMVPAAENGGAVKVHLAVKRRGPMDETRQLVRIVANSIPDSVTLLSSMTHVSKEGATRYFDKLLAVDAPKPEIGENWMPYMTKLISWATGRNLSEEEIRSVFKRRPGCRWEVDDVSARSLLGSTPSEWAIPIRTSEGNVVLKNGANKRTTTAADIKNIVAAKTKNLSPKALMYYAKVMVDLATEKIDNGSDKAFEHHKIAFASVKRHIEDALSERPPKIPKTLVWPQPHRPVPIAPMVPSVNFTMYNTDIAIPVRLSDGSIVMGHPKK